MKPPLLVWFRLDLRVSDNPALSAAAAQGRPVIPIFIWSPHEEQPWSPGAASRWWLHQSLARLDSDLRGHGSRLMIRRGDSWPTLEALIEETGAAGVYWNRRYEPMVMARDTLIKSRLRDRGLQAESYHGQLLFEPMNVRTRAGLPFQVFTAFWKACQDLPRPEPPQPPPDRLIAPPRWPASQDLDELRLEPRLDWAAGFRDRWQPGTAGAERQLSEFIQHALATYDSDRDLPAVAGTSRLSPHLHFGEISPRRVWQAIDQRQHKHAQGTWDRHVDTYRRELGWREFAHHLLFHFPHTTDQPLRPAFADFPWQDDPQRLQAWQRGQTGFPIVDAGMRELWTTGWMHNRVRMIVASFLVKDLQISWHHGAKWFWDTLVDADLANNTLGWQWSAGCGADAAPYFRIFNPLLQSKKFDSRGQYLRRWLPKLAGLPDPWLHQPHAAPAEVLAGASVQLGLDYPRPIVAHASARDAALAAFRSLKRPAESNLRRPPRKG